MSFSASKELVSYLEEQHYKKEYYKYNIFNILYKYNNNKYILDSSLISQTNRKLTDLKIVRCGDYLQFYFLPPVSYYTDKSLIKVKNVDSSNTGKVDTKKEYLHRELNLADSSGEPTIDAKNIRRSKISLQTLIKTNEKIFKTFITLTFAENIVDIKEANKKFNTWRTYIKRLKPDFAYVCVPEFQKRGAVHYHLMTNISYDDFNLLSADERKIYNPNSGWKIGRDIKGWSYGYNMAINMADINITGYLTKYFTKDIDNRLFGKHRFFYSQNLEKPEIILLDLTKFQDMSRFQLLNTFEYEFEEMTYSTKYENLFGDTVVFIEYKGKFKKIGAEKNVLL